MSIGLLVDNDVVIKLARMNAFTDGMQSVGAKPGQIGSLRVMLRYMGIADRSRRERLTQDKAEADRLNTALHSLVEVEITEAEAKTAAAVMKLVIENGLDLQEGELSLMVVSAARGQIDVSTGDKRALRSLPALASVWLQAASLRGKFICLEQIFKRLCEIEGLARIQKAVSTSQSADTTIAYVYQKTSASGGKGFITGMKMVLDEHVEKPAPGWLKPL